MADVSASVTLNFFHDILCQYHTSSAIFINFKIVKNVSLKFSNFK